jgi:hypothetical protein
LGARAVLQRFTSRVDRRSRRLRGAGRWSGRWPEADPSRAPTSPTRNGRLLAIKRGWLYCRGQRFESPQLHHPVLPKCADFRVWEKRLEINGLGGLKCGLRSGLCSFARIYRWKRLPVSGGKIPFPKGLMPSSERSARWPRPLVFRSGLSWSLEP